ncbi:MAG: hypothetical protein WBP64_06740 [Nitrososphaeraceae archaeon]
MKRQRKAMAIISNVTENGYLLEKVIWISRQVSSICLVLGLVKIRLIDIAKAAGVTGDNRKK